MTKLLIDECLSDALVHVARKRGYAEATHVVWMGKAGWKDWQLKELLLSEDWVLVTKNSKDFRGPREAPGSRGQFAGLLLHPGLICINGPVGMGLSLQIALFERALDKLDLEGDLINQVLEIDCGEDCEVTIRRYDLPKITTQR